MLNIIDYRNCMSNFKRFSLRYSLYGQKPVLTPLKLCFDPVKTLYVPQNVAQMYHNYKSFSKNSKNGKNSKLTTSCN